MSYINFTEADLQHVVPGSPLELRMKERLSEQTSTMWEKFIEASQQQCWDGEIEVDQDAIVSLSDDDGAYVLAWLWVYNKDAGLPSIHDEENDEDEDDED